MRFASFAGQGETGSETGAGCAIFVPLRRDGRLYIKESGDYGCHVGY